MMARCVFRSLLLFIGCWVYIWAMPVPSLFAEPEEYRSAPAASDSDFGRLKTLIESSLETEAKGIDMLRRQLDHVEKTFNTMTMELNAYEIQINTYSDLLLFPNARLVELEKALSIINRSIVNIEKHRDTLNEERSLLQKLETQTQEQVALHEKQQEAIRQMSDNPLTVKLLADSNRLAKLLEQKLKLIGDIDEWYRKGLDRLSDIHRKLTDFKPKFEQGVQDKKKEILFKREAAPVYFIPISRIDDEFIKIWNQIRITVEEDFTVIRQRIREGGYLPVSVFFLLFALLQWGMFRFRRYCRAMQEKLHLDETHPFRCAALDFFTDSLPLIGAIVFMYGYGKVRGIYFIVSLVRIIFYLLCVFLFSRWGMHAIRIWQRLAKTPPDSAVVRRLVFLVNLIRIIASIGVLLYWAVRDHGFLVFTYRTIFGFILLVWSMMFWRMIKRKPRERGDKRATSLQWYAMTLNYGIVVTGLILDLVGYGPFSFYWYSSWALTLAFAVPFAILFFVLLEWRREYKAEAKRFPGESRKGRELRWLLLQVSWIVWTILVFDGLLFAWFPDKTLYFDTVLQILNKPLPLPSLHLSVLSLSLVTFILILTHTAAGIWQKVLPEKILGDSGMDTGLKNSITMITVYLMWFVGILTALTILGFSSKSMAVAFGGLGIGLGFGLQAIFNNFISGIILLFERPIQVGDAVEIGGVWGEIRKINVRSTHVQTYDNASLIIPNSEFISSQVTNWSFKDPRLRRQINVGVAYGSDIELVRKTLLEIADNTQHVLKYPAPSVLFTDFGDSALIFRLRIWTDVDNCLIAETDIRFQIDRRFKEQGIEIAFPQRDIHIRSVTSDFREPQLSSKTEAAPVETSARSID